MTVGNWVTIIPALNLSPIVAILNHENGRSSLLCSLTMFRLSASLIPRLAFLLLAPLVGALPAAHAKTFVVQNLNDSGPGSLREAITSANSSPGADLVDASARNGTLKLLSALPLLQSQMVIKGSLVNPMTIQRNARAPFNLFSVAKGASVRLQGLILTGGGGGLETGGAISNDGALALLNCTLTGNAARRGGAVFSTGAVTVEDCTFSGNTASGGGAINCSGGLLTVSTSTFSGNSSLGDGGALVLLQTQTSLSRCTFANNHTARAGYGGAILASGQFPLTRVGLAIANCTFAGNIARQGGALWTSGQRTEIKNVTISDNVALAGAGIWSAGDAATLTYLGGCIVAGNATSPSAVGRDADSDAAKNTFVSRGYNLVGDGSGRSSFSQIGDMSGISRQGLEMGALGDNGGPTQTLAPLASSPALNIIPVSALLVKVDQRGKARPIGKGGDIGAVEADDSPITGSTLMVNTTSDSGDGVCTVGDCTLREALDTANKAAAGGSKQIYTITFDPTVFSTPQSIGVAQLPSRDDRLGFIATGNMKIIGPGADLLTIQLGQFNGLSPRLLNTGGSVEISGITFRGGRPYGDRGGAIYNTGTLVLSACVFADNVAHKAGGAIYNVGKLSVRGCLLTGNSAITNGFDIVIGTAGFGGGAIKNVGTLSLSNSTLSNNVTGSECAGGALNSEGAATVENCTIAGNTASTAGGGIYSSGSATLTVFNSTISGNIAFIGGGGGICSSSPLALRNSTLTQNLVQNDNGSNNSGGGVAVGGFTSTIENCTIVGNDSPSYYTSGVFADAGTTTITNSVIAANPYNNVRRDVSRNDSTATIVSGGYNFVGYGSGFESPDSHIPDDIFNAPGDRVGTYVVGIGPVALDPHLGTLASNGGAVQTIAPLPGSPLIDMGDPNFNASALPYDERGAGFPRVVGGRLDIGAFETSGAAASPKPNAKSRASAGSS